MELARLRLRGIYAIVAGALLLFAAPLYEALAVGNDYSRAVAEISRSRSFLPYLTWLATHLATDQTLRILQVAPLLLALTLPGALARWLWPSQGAPRLIASAAGWSGLGAFALAGIIGLAASARAAADFQAASYPDARANIALTFGQNYALQSLLSRTFGGVALAIFLAMISVRFLRVTRLPRWAAYLGGLVAALEAANAVFFLLNPLNIQAPTNSFSLAGLAAWLLVIGVALWQTTNPGSGVAAVAAEKSASTAVSPDAPSSDNGADA
ncbi:MAG TPA: hypothetical protein VF808_00935 [Ktedonobacterales bacterium]